MRECLKKIDVEDVAKTHQGRDAGDLVRREEEEARPTAEGRRRLSHIRASSPIG